MAVSSTILTFIILVYNVSSYNGSSRYTKGIVTLYYLLTFGRIARIEDKYVMQIATGEAYKEKDAEKNREAMGFLRLPYAAIKLDGDPQNFV